MTFGRAMAMGPHWVFAAARMDTGVVYYVGLAIIVAIMIGTIIAFYRTWAEIHEDTEPDSPQELFEAFREAHAAGQIDDRELERVRGLLTTDEGLVPGADQTSPHPDSTAPGGSNGTPGGTVSPPCKPLDSRTD